jgi:cation diffusion facilitator family transporter
MQSNKAELIRQAKRLTGAGIVVNIVLSVFKILAGWFGQSSALIADGVESAVDAVGSSAVLLGIWLGSKPPTEKHPYGQGRAETLASLGVALLLVFVGVGIAYKSVNDILEPHISPHPGTLVVVVFIIAIKLYLYRRSTKVGVDLNSLSMKADAWHHLADGITTLAALIGIAIAVLGGPGYEVADAWAALFASLMILFSAGKLFTPAMNELLDTSADQEFVSRIRTIACSVDGVSGTHRCHIRKLGFNYYVDLDLLVDGDISVRTGHDLAHTVQARIKEEFPLVNKVFVHVEPRDDFGRMPIAGPDQ